MARTDIIPMDAVVFDLDGTLVDTLPISLLGTRHVFERFVSRAVPDEEIIPLYGTPLIDIMARYRPDKAQEMVDAFEEFYLEHHRELVKPFPGVMEMLSGLRERGYPLAVLSNKRKEPGLRELLVCGLDVYFHSVLFLEDLKTPKPAAEALRQSARALGLPGATRVLYVGDSVLDVLCAHNAGARSAAALWAGLARAEGLIAQRPDHLLESAEDLLALCPPRNGATG